jgi:hypothetical protein
MAVVITSARVDAANGTVAAIVELVAIGGGSQVVTVDGTAEERIHPSRTVYHVRFISPDRMLPDELRVVDSFEEGCALGEKYAARLDEHARRVADLAMDLRI